MYGSYVTIPKERAVRLSSEEESLLDDNGDLCQGSTSKKRTLRRGIDRNLVELNTTVTYKASGNVRKLFGINNTVSLEDIKEKDFSIKTRARYNTTIVDNSKCTQVEKRVEGTMVQLYETNPNGANTVSINIKLFTSSITLFVALNVFLFRIS